MLFFKHLLLNWLSSTSSSKRLGIWGTYDPKYYHCHSNGCFVGTHRSLAITFSIHSMLWSCFADKDHCDSQKIAAAVKGSASICQSCTFSISPNWNCICSNWKYLCSKWQKAEDQSGWGWAAAALQKLMLPRHGILLSSSIRINIYSTADKCGSDKSCKISLSWIHGLWL